MKLFFALWALATWAHAYVAKPDITYDVVGGVPVLMDAFFPTRPELTQRPALVFIHGGCFSGGSRKDIPEEIKQMADAGFTVFSLGYRLSNVAKYPAAVSDVQQGIRFIRRSALEFQIDPTKIVVHGESAGGYLAAVTGLRALPSRAGEMDEFSERVPLVSDWFGRTDFTAKQTTGADCAESFLGLKRDQAMDAFKEASLMKDVDQNSAQFLIMHGTDDNQVYPFHSSLLANKLWKTGKKADLIFYEKEGHGFSRALPWKITKDYIFSFFQMSDKGSFINFVNFGLKKESEISGTFDVELKTSGSPVPVLLKVQNSDFDIRTQKLSGRVGLISKTGKYSLEAKNFTDRAEMGSVQLSFGAK